MKEENDSIEEKEDTELLETYGEFYIISLNYYFIYIGCSLNSFLYIFELIIPYIKDNASEEKGKCLLFFYWKYLNIWVNKFFIL